MSDFGGRVMILWEMVISRTTEDFSAGQKVEKQASRSSES
jgi:hypothetical protein